MVKSALAGWRRNVYQKLSGEKGWLLIGKLCFNVVALFAAGMTCWSIIANQASEQSSDLLRQSDRIESGLLAINPWERLAALHQLRAFAFHYPHTNSIVGSPTATPFDLAKRMLLEKFGQFKNEGTADEGHDAVRSDTAPTTEEKDLSLRILAEMGVANWQSPSPLQTTSANIEFPLQFSWIAVQPESANSEVPVSEILQDRNFNHVDLAGADFSCVDLGRTVFSYAKLSRTIFLRSVLANSSFIHTHLEFLNMYGAEAKQADFSYARITGMTTQRQAPQSSYSPSGSAEEQRSKCMAGRTDLTGARFANAQLLNSSFDEADMQGAVFAPSLISGVRFTKTNLIGAQFAGASISEATFRRSKLMASSFDHTRISGTVFWHADISQGSFSGAHIADEATKLSILDAKISGTNFLGAIETSDPLFCDFVEKQAVFVSDIDGWEDHGRKLDMWRQFTSPEIKKAANKCAMPHMANRQRGV